MRAVEIIETQACHDKPMLTFDHDYMKEDTFLLMLNM